MNQIEVGTKFICNANGVKMEVVGIQFGRCPKSRLAILKNLSNGKETISTYGYEALKRCDITIIS